MDLEAGNIYTNGNEYRKILNINNNMIEYEKLQVIKCEDVNSFSNWATENNHVSQTIDRIITKHFSTTYSRDLEEDINDWLSSMNYYIIIDIDIKYSTIYIDCNNSTRYSALVVLKLQEI